MERPIRAVGKPSRLRRRRGARTLAGLAALAVAVSGLTAPDAVASSAAARGKRPPVQVEKPVPGHAPAPHQITHKGTLPTAAKAGSTALPAAGTALVSVPASGPATADAADSALSGAQAGSLPVRLSAADKASTAAGAQVSVTVADQTTAQAAGVQGLLVSLTPVTGGGRVGVNVDTSSLAGLYGAGFESRLRLVELPACALTTPDVAACRVQTPVTGAALRPGGHSLSAAVSLPAATAVAGTPTAPAAQPAAASPAAPRTASIVLAATADASGATGSFTATSLSPSSQWSAGSNSGDFTWSYPLSLPTPFAGTAPPAAVVYDSGTVDGHSDSTNNQTSPIGEGFELGTGGFIERSYKSCSEDTDLPTSEQTGDLCWAGQVLNLSLDGKSTALVWDPTTNDVHPADDHGERVQLLTNASNGVHNGEYWKVTTTDGTQYYFGRDHGPGYTNQADTNSAWTVPVYGAHSGDPCYNATFTQASCLQAWRWNLDYVEDTHGNVTMFYYTPETNYYTPDLGQNSASPVKYTSGGVLEHLEYGLRDDNGTVYANPAVDKVVFPSAERCIPNENSDGFSCDPSLFTAANASHWHDVPFDQYCAQGAKCSNYSPSFWSRRRITGVTTQVYTGGSYQNVDTYAFTQAYPDTGDGTPYALSLATIQHCGSDGTTCTPTVKFLGSMLANRVPVTGQTAAYYPAINKWRLTEVDTESGEQIQVTYNTPACSPSNLPSSDSTDTLDCFPEYWTPLGATTPIKSYFYHYTVNKVTETDPTGGAPDKITSYAYLGGAAWHFDDSELSKASQRTYAMFRGYAHVQTRVGTGPTTLTDTLFLRGMDGDILPSGKRSVTVTDVEKDDTVTDADSLAGAVFETDVYTGDGGTIDHGTVTDYTVTGPTATRTRTGLNPLQALMTVPTRVRDRQALAQPAGAWRRTVVNTAYNSLGLPTQVDDESDGTQPSCTRTSYLTNTAAWLTASSESVVTGEVCPSGTQAGKLVSDTRTSYDGQAFGTAPTAGNATSVQTAASSSDGTATGALTWAPSATTTFDSYGRQTGATDVMGRQTSVAYTPATLGPVTQVVHTNLASTDPLTRSTTTVTDPLRGRTTASIDVAGLRSDAVYDALGRLTQVWQPGRSKAAGQTPNFVYAYSISNTAPSTVISQRLLDDDSYTSTITLYDALLRTRQTQADAEGGGRVLNDTVYDNHGWAVKTNDGYFATGAPATTLYLVGDSAIPSQTLKTYDGLGRVTSSAAYHYANYTWETDSVYGGDRTTILPPAGGVATTTILDARGVKSEIDQYTSAPTVTGGVVTGTINGSGTKYGYDFAGRLATITDPTGKNQWTYGYDLRGRRTSQSDPDSGLTTYTYDDDNEITASTDARGQTVAFKYDNLGRKLGEYTGSTTGPPIARWTYDSLMKGKPTASAGYTNGLGYITAFTGYNSAGLPTGTSVTIPSGEGALSGTYTTSYGYTPNTGMIQTVTEPAAGPLPSETVTTAYTRLGRPYSTEGQNYYVSSTSYSPYGEALQYTQGPSSNPVWQTLTYDDQTRRETEARIDEQAAPPQVDKVDYTYDTSGQVTQITDLRGGTSTDTQCFNYDGLGELAQAWTATDNCAANPATAGNGTVGSAIAPYWTSWTYDTVGDRLSQVQHALPGSGTGDTTTAYTYPAAGSPQPHTLLSTTVNGAPTPTTQYGYDATGSTTSRTTPGVGTQTLNWDAAGHLTSVAAAAGTTSYVYDADGNELMRKDPGQNSLYVGDTELVLNTTANTVSATRYYKHNGATVAALDSTSGHVSYLMPDRQGTADVSVDSTTATANFRDYTPFGDVRGTAPASWVGQLGYIGVGTADPTTGLTDLGAREYDPSIGRFISVDPVFEDGQATQMGGYAYAGDDPVGNSDPSGLFCWGLCSISNAWKDVKTGVKVGYATVDESAGNIFFGSLEMLDPVKEGEGWLHRVHAQYNADDDKFLSPGQRRFAHDGSNVLTLAAGVDGAANLAKSLATVVKESRLAFLDGFDGGGAPTPAPVVQKPQPLQPDDGVYAYGPNGARPAPRKSDYTFDDDGKLPNQTPNLGTDDLQGQSTFVSPDTMRAGFGGKEPTHFLSRDDLDNMDPRLGWYADGNPFGHVTIYPTEDMTFSSFTKLVKNLPWRPHNSHMLEDAE